MSETATVKTGDGHILSLYVARPSAKPLAGLVVLQEIFGVNRHIRSVVDGFASDGYLAVAPALFDRIERNVQLGYEGEDAKRGIALLNQTDTLKALADVDAALAFTRKESNTKTGVIGYCFGGLLAWLSSTRLHPDAAVGYYAGRIGTYAAEAPLVPTQLHFGRLDTHIPAEEVERVHSACPDVEINWYDDAGHGFNCEMRAAYNAQAADLARSRSLAFFRQHLA
ncbi:MAG: dienelactone hydrolase family protein [Terracidiphilus sp.]